MNKRLVSCAALVIWCAVLPCRASAQTKVHLEGFVYDSARKPLGGVDVAAWVSGSTGSVGGGTTDATTGKYSFDITVQDGFDLSFSMSKYRTSVVTFLAEQKPHQISKILYRRGEKKTPPTAAHAYIQSINRIGFLALSLPQGERGKFMEHFEDAQKSKELFRELRDVDVWIDMGGNKAVAEMLADDISQAEKNLLRLERR